MLLQSKPFPRFRQHKSMPGPRNWRRQKKGKGVKGKKGKGSETCELETGSIAIPEEERVSGETSSLREPPVYDPGTGPRVRSMGEFLGSSFASEPTWDDELCAEFAQEEMVEMLREVLPEEMALVSTCDVRDRRVGGNELV